MLLNSKSIIDCEENEEKKHNEEIMAIVDKVSELPNYDCAVIIKHMDEAHKSQKDENYQCKLHDFLDVIEYVDFKNGIDLEIGECNLLTINTYGQIFTYSNGDKSDYVRNVIHIVPFEKNGDAVDISKYLVEPIDLIFESKPIFH